MSRTAPYVIVVMHGSAAARCSSAAAARIIVVLHRWAATSRNIATALLGRRHGVASLGSSES
jgi:hypothetical protein